MLTGLILAQALAAPRSVPPLDLRWEVAPEARACPGEQWFRDELASHLGRDPFVHEPGPPRGEVRVRIVGSASVVAAEVFLATTPQETPRSVARGEGPPRRCRELLGHAIEALEDVLLPREMPAPINDPSPAPPRTPVVETESPPRVLAVATAAAPRAELPTPAGAPPVEHPAPATAWHGHVAVVAGAGFAGVPAPVSPVVGASLYMGRGMFDGVVGVSVEPLAGGATVPSAAGNLEIEMERVGVELGACFARPHLRLCGLGVARWMWARAPGVGSAPTETGYQIGGAVRAEGRLPVGQWVDLLGRVDLSLTGPKEFYVQGCGDTLCANWRVGVFSAVIAVGAAVRGW